jgi:hypothetical protein
MKTIAAITAITFPLIMMGVANGQNMAEIGRTVAQQCAYADGASEVCLSKKEASVIRFRCTEFERVFRFITLAEYGEMVALARESIRVNGGDCSGVKEHAEKVSLFAMSKVMGY